MERNKKIKHKKLFDKVLGDFLIGIKNKQPHKEDREKEIEEFIASLKEMWLKNPQQRFTQLLFNYTKMGTPINKEIGPELGLKDFYYYSDKEILKQITDKINGKEVS
jgi:hypothetical protein